MYAVVQNFGRRPLCVRERFFLDNLLVRIHLIIEMIWWAGLAPWEFEFLFPDSRVSTFLCVHYVTVVSSLWLLYQATPQVIKSRPETSMDPAVGRQSVVRKRGGQGVDSLSIVVLQVSNPLPPHRWNGRRNHPCTGLPRSKQSACPPWTTIGP